MALVFVLLGIGVVMGAAAHMPLTVFAVASAAVTAWLLAFAVREAVARRRG
ncbi:hypothetical protein [Streptomyces sp. NPDC020983]|uniref:hypothetical protein n=1 Tax=Streptomyces sp. NPDC020983 TaxID=3365106 RepID=UPI003795D7BB